MARWRRRACAHGQACGGLKVASVHQEHGIIAGQSPIPFESFPIGARVRVLPNHACMTGAADDAYNVIDGGAEVIARWGRRNGW